VPPLSGRTFAATAAVPLSYKLVRPASVAAELDGPGNAVVPIDAGRRGPGIYRFTWPAGSHPTGDWTFRVVATDDQSRQSTAERDFTLK
jgi:hypothetical protein